MAVAESAEADRPGSTPKRSIGGKVILLTALSACVAAALAVGVSSWGGGVRGIGLIVVLAALGAGLTAAWRLRSGRSRPIQALAGAVDQAAHDHDYTLTLEVPANAEAGALARGFNSLMAEIRARDARIAVLEGEVAARTADHRHAAAAAQTSDMAKSDFLATINHEIRTPMNGIMVMAEMLAAGDLAPRQRRFAEVIAKSGSSLLAVIDDILDLSKIEAGKLTLEWAPVDLADIVDDVASLFWDRAASKGLDLAAYVDPATPRLVAADPVRLRQVVGALVNNAIKFTPAGGVLIEVEPDSAGSVRICVHDTGVGMLKHKIADVFGVDRPSDPSAGPSFGASLGLSICKRLVDAMGGRFAVTSEVGRGSTFAFRLPVKILEAAAPWPEPLEEKSRALIAHPGPSTRRALGRYLARTGFALAKPGETDIGLAMAAASAVDGLPESSAQVVCLADFGDSRPRDLKDAGKADAVLTQPFRSRDLEALLRQYAAGKPLNDAGDDHTGHAAGPPLPHFAGARVLVADDSAVHREVAMEALARLSIQPVLVADGREAVNAAMAEPFDLILMDGSMPQMDGYEAALEIRRLEIERGGRRTPIVAFTAHVVGSVSEAWRDAGMDAMLPKPFTLASLAKTIGQFLTPSAAPAEVVDIVAHTRAILPVDSNLIDAEVANQLASMAGPGKTDFIAKVHGIYRDNAPPCIGKLNAAVEARSAGAAAKAAHALKSMSFNIGAREVARRAGEIESAGRAGRLPTPGEIAGLEDVLTRTLQALSARPTAADVGPAMDSDTRALLYDLERAIERDELSLVYQPQYDRDGAAILGVETLVRWVHPTRGPVSPALFIPLAEAHGLIAPVTTWVLDRLMAETKDLDVSVGFNASAIEFAEPGFVGRIDGLIRQHGYKHNRLEIEITETAILSGEQQVRENMEQLRDLGLTVALDDFGAGYSSLRHLRRFPFDKLKIDREFIADCTDDVQSATVVHAVVSIGRALGMKVVAEGVETELQKKFLKVAGVHALQGYLFGRPLPIDALKLLLEAIPEEEAATG